MSPGERQHVVPRRYLKHFADEEDRVLTLRLGVGGGNFLQSTRRAGAVNDFYTVRLPSGETDSTLEKWLAQAEDEAYPAFTAVEDGQWPLGENTRQRLARWIALQWLRGGPTRDLLAKTGTETLDEFFSEPGLRALVNSLSSNRADMDTDELWPRVLSGATDVERKLREEARSGAWHVNAIKRHETKATELFMHRPWFLVRFQRHRLATSDHPVALHASGMRQPGLQNAEFATFPLDRRSGLIMGPRVLNPRDSHLAPTTLRARLLNAATYSSAHSTVFHHPEDQLVGIRAG